MVTAVSRLRSGSALLAFLLTVLVAASSALAGLSSDIRELVNVAELGTATVSVSVRNCETGSELVSVEAGRRMIPASNMKLLTSGAALHVLGPDFSFRTKMVRRGRDLIVVGDGDPGFGDAVLLGAMAVRNPDGTVRQGMDVEQFLSLWVDAIVAAGITSIDRVIVDDRIFVREYAHPNWPKDQLNRRYCAEISGLNFQLNTLHFFPRPVPGSAPDIIDMRPRAGWIFPTNGATSRQGRRDGQTVYISRAHHTNKLRFHGNVRHRPAAPLEVTLHDVPAFFAQLLADRIDDAGVTVSGHGIAAIDDPLAEGVQIGATIQTPMATALHRCNTDSQNVYAECLLKRMAFEVMHEPASWTTGTAMLRHVVHDRLSTSLASKIIADDGSGLSRENRVTASAMTAWLDSFHNDARLGPAFIGSLALAGSTGTVQKRFKGLGRHGEVVRCKTGYINGVSCLSGYVTLPDGRRRSFSVLCNDLTRPGSVARAKKLQDAIVQAIADDMAVVPSLLGGG